MGMRVKCDRDEIWYIFVLLLVIVIIIGLG